MKSQILVVSVKKMKMNEEIRWVHQRMMKNYQCRILHVSSFQLAKFQRNSCMNLNFTQSNRLRNGKNSQIKSGMTWAQRVDMKQIRKSRDLALLKDNKLNLHFLLFFKFPSSFFSKSFSFSYATFLLLTNHRFLLHIEHLSQEAWIFCL